MTTPVKEIDMTQAGGSPLPEGPQSPPSGVDGEALARHWLKVLSVELRGRHAYLNRRDKYYSGDHPLMFATDKFKETFGGVFEAFSDNWCGVVVDSTEERLQVQGFRGSGRPDTSEEYAARIWEANYLESESMICHSESLIASRCYGMVWPSTSGGLPDITIESAEQMIVANVPGHRRRRAAALKIWKHGDGESATVYLPGTVWKFTRKNQVDDEGADIWEKREVQNERWPLKNPFGVVPVVPFPNKPRLTAQPSSEIDGVIPLQDGVNKLLADMFVAAEFSAMRARWITGMQIPKDENNEPIKIMEKFANRVFHSEDPNVKVGEFGTTNLSNFVTPIEMLIQHIASQTSTPPHYFFIKGQFPNAESMQSAEVGLAKKVERIQRFHGVAWAELMSLAYSVTDEVPNLESRLVCIWGDPQTRSESQHVDALVKLRSLGIPDEFLWEKIPLSINEIGRVKVMIREAIIRGDLIGDDLIAFDKIREGSVDDIETATEESEAEDLAST